MKHQVSIICGNGHRDAEHEAGGVAVLVGAGDDNDADHVACGRAANGAWRGGPGGGGAGQEVAGRAAAGARAGEVELEAVRQPGDGVGDGAVAARGGRDLERRDGDAGEEALGGDGGEGRLGVRGGDGDRAGGEVKGAVEGGGLDPDGEGLRGAEVAGEGQGEGGRHAARRDARHLRDGEAGNRGDQLEARRGDAAGEGGLRQRQGHRGGVQVGFGQARGAGGLDRGAVHGEDDAQQVAVSRTAVRVRVVRDNGRRLPSRRGGRAAHGARRGGPGGGGAGREVAGRAAVRVRAGGVELQARRQGGDSDTRDSVVADGPVAAGGHWKLERRDGRAHREVLLRHRRPAERRRRVCNDQGVGGEVRSAVVGGGLDRDGEGLGGAEVAGEGQGEGGRAAAHRDPRHLRDGETGNGGDQLEARRRDAAGEGSVRQRQGHGGVVQVGFGERRGGGGVDDGSNGLRCGRSGDEEAKGEREDVLSGPHPRLPRGEGGF